MTPTKDEITAIAKRALPDDCIRREKVASEDFPAGLYPSFACEMRREGYASAITRLLPDMARLREYAQHKPTCSHWLPFAGDPRYIPCDCGYAEACARFDDLIKP